MDGVDYHAVLTTDGLVAEVAAGTFAFKNKLKALSIKLLWEKLGSFIAETLRAQKGVLLPNLGSFKVGPVVGESRKKIRPAFSLLEGRYGPISQERPKYLIGGKAPVVQPNYALLSQAAAVHRGIGQRLLAELLQRLGVHILSSRIIRVEFPYLGKLITNRAGRIEFVFDTLLAEYFERESYAVIKEMPYSPLDYDVTKHVADQDSSSRAQPPVTARTAVTRRKPRPTGTPVYTAPLHQLLALCREADRTVAGCVPRLRMEQWMQQHCKDLLADISGAALMDLLDRHTYGKNSKQIMYGQFLDALDDALSASTHYHAPDGVAEDEVAANAAAYEAASPNSACDDGGEDPDIVHAEVTAQDLVVHPPHSPAAAPLQQAVTHAVTQMRAPKQPPPPTPDRYLHYVQNKLSPRSRSEFDAFNRAHFQQLDAARGRRVPSKTLRRAVTPKVGADPLNMREYQAVRSASPQHLEQPPWLGSGLMPSPPPARALGAAASPSPRRPGAAAPASPSPRAGEPLASTRPAAADAPPARYVHEPQVLTLLHADDPSVPPAPPSPSKPVGPGHEQAYNILAPPPMPQAHRHAPPQALSQYDIMREQDPDARKELKARYAAELQSSWYRQIRQKEELEGVLNMKEAAGWPFAPVHVPMDKRPPSAISKPPTAALSPRSRQP